ncbi:MAG: hypothetical protein MR936_14930 [Eubacterium sp.]|nr:hypothetical protein [Eubacterium sp.]
MTAKEYLSELQLINTKIEQLQEQRQMYLDRGTSITAPISPVKVQTSGTIDRMGDNISQAADLGNEIDEEINKLRNRQYETIKMIQSLHNVNHMQVLFKVYVQFKTVKIAADEIGISYQYAKEVHKKALAAFEAVHTDILTL